MAENDTVVVARELRERNDSELRSLRESKLEELQQAQFKHALGQLRETHRLKGLRIDVARLNTVLSERKHADKKEQQA